MIRRICLAVGVAVASIAGGTFSFAADAATIYQVGVATVDVTPGHPVRLSGYSNRKSEFESVEQPLHAKALAIKSDGKPAVVLVTVDSLGVSAGMTASVAKRVGEKFDVPRANVCISASHTHTAPALAHTAKLLFPPPLPEEHAAHMAQYEQTLTEKLGDVALAALSDLRPAILEHAVGEVKFAVNRRLLKDGKWAGFGVVPEGAVDHALPVLFVKEVDGKKLRAVLINYACHCTTLGGNFNRVHGDWAGCAQEQLQRELDGVTALVSIGCGADANPEPRKDDLAIVQQHGDAIAREVKRLIGQKQTPLSGPITAEAQSFELPLADLPTKAEYEARLAENGRPIAWHAQAQLDRLARGEKLPTAVPYSRTTWTFGDSLAMVFLPGEVVVDYQLRLKRMFDPKRLWINAYSNDSPCYIASKRVLGEGGYEVDGSMYYYDQPQHFAPEVEDTLVRAVAASVPTHFAFATRFAADVAKLEAKDESSNAPRGGILFIGSSTIVRWNLSKWFEPLSTVNHGFGGSHIADSIHYFDRLVTPLKPRQIVFFAGGNDIASGKTPEEVHADLLTFIAMVRRELPETRLTYIAITPSVKRWAMIDMQRKFNESAEASIAAMHSPLVEFIQVEDKFLDAAGQPQPRLYVADLLHLNDDGYKILSDIVRPYLK